MQAVAAGKMGKWRRRRRSARAEKNAGSISSLRFVMPRTAATEYEHHRPDKNGVPLSDFMQAISGNVLQNYRYFSPIFFPFGFCAGSARERHRSSVCIRWASQAWAMSLHWMWTADPVSLQMVRWFLIACSKCSPFTSGAHHHNTRIVRFSNFHVHTGKCGVNV